MKIYRKTTYKKEKGSAALGKFLPLLLVIVVVAMLVTAYADYIRILDIKDEISLTMRKYIIRMETEGYMTDSDKKAMVSELKGFGMTDIDLSGTTMEEVGYGGVINLCVSGRLKAQTYSIISVFEGEFVTDTIRIHEVRSSTSQQ